MINSVKTGLEVPQAEPEAGKAELEAMTQMVIAWKENYLQWECKTAAADFMEEIDHVVYPYLRRLFECGFIDGDQFRQFLSFCDSQMLEISKSGSEVS